MPEQDPIPPRRHARRYSPGEDDEPPPWANLPSVRPARPGAPAGPARSDGQVRADGPGGRPGAHGRPDGPGAYGRPDGPGAYGRPDGPWPADWPGRSTPPGGMPERPMTPPGGMPARPATSPYPGQPAFPGSGGPAYTGPGGPGGPSAPGGRDFPERPGGNQQLGSYDPTGYVDPADFDDAADAAARWAIPPEADDEAPRGRTGRARLKLARKRRRTWIMTAAVAALVVVVAGVYFGTRGGGNTADLGGGLVNYFLPGELQKVPNACDVVSEAIVKEYLPGQVKQAAPQDIDGSLSSGCNWIVDAPPTYRLLELNVEAYKYTGLASGDGSATENAIGNYAQQLQAIQDPAKDSYAAKAVVATVPSLGDQAFSAIQVFHPKGAATDVVSVVVRYRNVIIQAIMNAPASVEHTKKGTYDPANVSQLKDAALAFAQAAEAALTTS
ncbi:MAG TPA: hypothetical protein VN969_32885 [Streptosporangiaceae bacterium]|nr:hypothetical protein [Streptosporangiaceae bacterium]